MARMGVHHKARVERRPQSLPYCIFVSLSELHLLPQEKSSYKIHVCSKLDLTVKTDNFKIGTFCTPITRGDRMTSSSPLCQNH